MSEAQERARMRNFAKGRITGMRTSCSSMGHGWDKVQYLTYKEKQLLLKASRLLHQILESWQDRFPEGG